MRQWLAQKKLHVRGLKSFDELEVVKRLNYRKLQEPKSKFVFKVTPLTV